MDSSSGNGHSLTLHGQAIYSPIDPEEEVFSLSSVHDNQSWAETPNVMTATDNITMSCWAKALFLNEESLILYNGHSGLNGYGIIIHGKNGYRLTLLLGGVQFVNTSVALQIAKWTHLAVVRRNGVWELWLDGGAVPLSNIATSPGMPGTSTVIGQNFTGLVDNVRIYDRALDTEELRILAAR